MIRQANMSEYLQAAIKAAGLRQSAIAENIANASTPGYRRKIVEFEKYLEKALASPERADPAKLQAEIKTLAGGVSLEREIGDLIQNSTMSKTYMRLLAKLYRQMEMAMQG